MSEQRYYKIISITTYDLIKPNDIENSPWKLTAKLSPELFTSTLNESLETIKLRKVCDKRNENFAFKTFPSNENDSQEKIPESAAFLGYQTILIILHIDEEREFLYKNGFDFNGKHYVRYKRSASSAKDGKCLFIQENFFEEMMKWSSCGLDPKKQKLQTDFQAYISLTLSGIKGTFRLPAESILLIDDVKSVFNDEVMQVSIKQDSRNEAKATASIRSSVEIQNTIWDGQAMLDESVFKDITGFEDKSMLLLRNRFFKTCAFRTRLQQWFSDNNIENIDELNGYTKAKSISDIKLVITTSSLKYYKFYKDNFSLEEILDKWLNAIRGKHLTFGIVKADLKSKFMEGRMCQTSYQFMATLGLSQEETHQLLQPSIDYLEKIKADEVFFRHYTKMQRSGINNGLTHDTIYLYDVCNYMTAITSRFASTNIYRNFFYKEIARFKNTLRRGEILVDGTYATLFGNPIEFLYATIHKNYNPNTTTKLYDKSQNPIPTLTANQVYTSFYNPGTELCCYRSPHTTMGNILLTKVADNQFIKNYFCLSDSILCVNAIEQNVMNRLNGADYDSDFVLMTNNSIIINSVRKYYSLFPVPFYSATDKQTNENEFAESNNYNSPLNLAKIDNAISLNLIGAISNLAFILNNILWDRLGEHICALSESELQAIKPLFYKLDIDTTTYDDLSALEKKILTVTSELYGFYQTLSSLAVLCGLEIDKAKRMYDFHIESIFNDIKKELTLLMLVFPSTDMDEDFSVEDDEFTPNLIMQEKLHEFIENILEKESSKILRPVGSLMGKIKTTEELKENEIKKRGLFLETSLIRTEWECTLAYLFSYDFERSYYLRGKAIPLKNLLQEPQKTDANASRQKRHILNALNWANKRLAKLRCAKNKKHRIVNDTYLRYQEILNQYFMIVSKKQASNHVVYSLISSYKGDQQALLYAGLLFSPKSALLSMLLDTYEAEITYDVIPAKEHGKDTVDIYGYPYQKVAIDKKALFAKRPE